MERIYIAGQEGMVGKSIYNLLKKNKYKLIECKRRDLNVSKMKRDEIIQLLTKND